MTKEQELMSFLHQKAFDPILNSKSCPLKIKIGLNIIIARMNRLTAEKMINYFLSFISTENVIKYSKYLKNEQLIHFENVIEEFKDKFNEKWLQL